MKCVTRVSNKNELWINFRIDNIEEMKLLYCAMNINDYHRQPLAHGSSIHLKGKYHHFAISRDKVKKDSCYGVINDLLREMLEAESEGG